MNQEILKSDLCAGCGLCESVFGKEKVSIQLNEEGFLRPIFKKQFTLEESSFFKDICPGITARHHNIEGHDPLWGPYLSITSGFSLNEKARYYGSSGGVLTAISSYLLDQNKVECVLHMGASISNPYQNEYKVSYTTEELIKNAGSRYAPSATLINIVSILKDHHSIAIVGKPCDIVGIRNFMKTDEQAKNKIKYLLSFMCAGVPSQNATKKIIEGFNLNQKDVASLRYRGEGWPGYFKIEDHNKNIHKMTYNESWGTVLNKELQFRCKICADGTGEFADIACADAWESSKNGYPSFEEKKGMSLIMIRNEKGKKLLEEVESLDYIKLSGKTFSSLEIAQMQPYQKQRKQNVIARLLALKLVGRKIHNYNKTLLFKAALKENPLRLFKNFLGMLKRI